jgi:hypothetical protein
MMNPVTHLEKVQVYLRSIENGNFGYITSLFSPDAVLEQLPNRIYPNGVRSGVSRMAEAFEKGRKLLSSQTYELSDFSPTFQRFGNGQAQKQLRSARCHAGVRGRR